MRRQALIAAALIAVAAVAAAAALWPRSRHESPPGLGKPTRHLALIVLENKEYDQVVGNPSAPYINHTLIPTGRLFTSYFAVRHPSLPNYLVMTSARFGPCSTDVCPEDALSTESLFHQMNAATAPISWKVYAEDMPSNCFASDSGLYAAHHNPAAYFRDIGPDGDDSCRRFDVPFTNLAKDITAGTLPRFAFIVPNVHDDMHTDAESPPCRLTSPTQSEVCQGDRWLRQILPALLHDAGRKDVTVLIVFDEGLTTSGGGGHVLLLEVGPPRSVCSGCTSTGTLNHYGLLAGIEDWFGLPHLSSRTRTRSIAGPPPTDSMTLMYAPSSSAAPR
jgi:phosphatidylinositol-3-phosphatase